MSYTVVVAAVLACSGVVRGAPAPAPAASSPPKRQPAESPATPDGEHYRMARVLERAHLYEDALREIDAAISINPDKREYFTLKGACLRYRQRYDEAIQAYNHALLLDPRDRAAQVGLRISSERQQERDKAQPPFEVALLLKTSGEKLTSKAAASLPAEPVERSLPDNSKPPSPPSAKSVLFETTYREGTRLLREDHFEEASELLAEAARLRPNDFNANLWHGMSLVRLMKFKEAIPSLEKARAIKGDSWFAKVELFGCYLATNDYSKAFHLFPVIAKVTGVALVSLYLAIFAVLVFFSFRVQPTARGPGLGFSLGWLFLYFEGQIAFLLLAALVFWMSKQGNAMFALDVGAIPIVIVALSGFSRQPWGEPFRWPWRFGSIKIVFLGLLLLFFSFIFDFGFSEALTRITHKALPLQRIGPFIKEALQANPILTVATIGFIVPVTEEVIFRGLLFGAFQKWLRPGWVIFWTALIFALVHLEIVGLIPLLYLGAMLGWARWKTKSLALPILLHSLNNCLAVIALTMQPD